jgi:hypothetical protein
LDDFHESLGENKDEFAPNAAFQYGIGSGTSVITGGTAAPAKRTAAAASSSSSAPAKSGAKTAAKKPADDSDSDDERPTRGRDHAQLANQLGRL